MCIRGENNMFEQYFWRCDLNKLNDITAGLEREIGSKIDQIEADIVSDVKNSIHVENVRQAVSNYEDEFRTHCKLRKYELLGKLTSLATQRQSAEELKLFSKRISKTTLIVAIVSAVAAVAGVLIAWLN